MAASGEGSSVSRSKKWTFFGRGGKRSSNVNYTELSPTDPDEVLAIQSGQGSNNVLSNNEHARGGNIFAGALRRPKPKKVILHHEEEAFIRSLGEVDAWDWESLEASPLLFGLDRGQIYCQSTKRKRLEKKNGYTLVPEGSKKTLVVNLCQTLVHISRTPGNCDHEIAFKVVDDQDAGGATARDIRFYVSLRPGLTKFLEQASALS